MHTTFVIYQVRNVALAYIFYTVYGQILESSIFLYATQTHASYL
jgi:hypothetical protein